MIFKEDNPKTILLRCLKNCIVEDNFFKGENTELIASTQTYMYQLNIDEYHNILIDYADNAKHYIPEKIRKQIENGIIEGLNAIRLTKHLMNNYCKDKNYILRVTILISYIDKEMK